MGTERDGDVLMERFEEAHREIRRRGGPEPRVGIVLGTGLGGVADVLDVDVDIPYEDIPHFPLSTLGTHRGRLLLGHLDDVPVVAMQGRFHRYEGYTLQEVTFPIRVLRLLGAETLVLSGACGAMNPLFSLGDIVLLEDQINLFGDSPLVGTNLDALGPRFPDMSEPYDRDLQARVLDIALKRGIRLQRGVYAGVTGPNLETRAEYRMLRRVGADVVGMSTVPEVIVARHMHMRVIGMTIVTDLCLPDALEPVDVPTILRTAKEAEPRLTALIRDVVKEL